MTIAARTSSRLVAALLIWATGCGGGAQLLGGRRGPDGSAGATGLDTDAADGPKVSNDGAADSPGDPTPALRCTDPGFAATAPGPMGEICLGDVASAAFKFALCSCGDLTWLGTLATDSFVEGSTPKGNNGAVGVDGHVVATNAFHVGGPLSIAAQPPDKPGLRMAAPPSNVTGDCHVGGGVAGEGMLAIGGDLYSDGDIACLGMTVSGAIHVPANRLVVGATAGKGTVREAVIIDRPCDCAHPVVDVAAVVAALGQANGNAAAGLAADALTAGSRAVDLPCGRYAFSTISGRDLTLRLDGATVIALSGDLSPAGNAAIQLAPGASLDLFVAGNVNLAGATAFGSVAAPARIRIYSAGSRVSLPTGGGVGANIYAPAAMVTPAASTALFGAVFGAQFGVAGSLSVHYDEDSASAATCPSPMTAGGADR